MSKHSYDQVISKLESADSRKKSDYMESMYESFHQMGQFARQDVDHHSDEDQHTNALDDLVAYQILGGAVERSYGLNDFVKYVKRMKEIEDGDKQELRQELGNEFIDYADDLGRRLDVRSDEAKKGVLDSADNATSDMTNSVETFVESVIGPAIRDID
jgi:hypothetical protein